MNRTEVCRRLHDMVDALMDMPADWFEEGVYPMLRIGFRNPTTDDEFTLVVGLEAGTDD